MTDLSTLDERLRAVERALTDGEFDLTEIENAADQHERFETVEERLTAVEDRLTDIEAATQSLRGYVGNVRAVNQEVERRADAALAAVESIETDDSARDSSPIQSAVVYPPPGRPDPENDDRRSADSPDPDEREHLDLLDRLREVL